MSDPNIDLLRLQYEATGNVMYVWQALASASVDKTRLPTWIADYLRQGAVALCRLDGDPKSRARKVCESLGFIRGNINAFAELARDNRSTRTALDSMYYGGGDQAAQKLAEETKAASANQLDAEMQKVRRRVKRATKNRRISE